MRSKNRRFLWIGLLALSMLFGSWGPWAESGSGSESDWPQWRGPNRDGISRETGLLKSWPKEGPKVLWKVPIGEGFSGISISGGRAYTMDSQDDDEFVVCLDASTGEEIWRFRSDKRFKDHQGGNGPRSTPTVDGDVVYALSAYGKLYALDAKDGEKVWGLDLRKRFGSKVPQWGYSESILTEGDLLFVGAGGPDGKSIVALDKQDGAVAWTAYTDGATYSSPIAVTVDGVRQILTLTANAAVSVSPTDGELYWSYPWETSYDVNAATPVFIPPDKVFISSAYDKGAAVLRISVFIPPSTDNLDPTTQIKENQAEIKVAELWKSRVMRNKFSSSVLYGDYIYGFDESNLKCIDANTGVEQWKKRGFGKGSFVLADGHLIILSDKGKLALAEATPTAYREKARAKVMRGRCWTVPTLAGGKLYLRNHKEMICLDVTGQI